MKIRQVSYAAMAIAGGLGLATGPAFAQPAPPAAVGAPTLTPMPPAPVEPVTPPTIEPAAPPVEPGAPPPAEPVAPPPGEPVAPPAEPLAPPAMAEPLGAIDGGRMMIPPAQGTGVRAEIMAIMMAQFHAMDANGDGRLTPEEFAAGWENAFLLLDQNADGFIDDADREIAARNLAATAAETRADRAATEGMERGGPGGDGRGAEERRGDGPGWGGHYERHENGGGAFFFSFPGGMMHFYMMPFGHGMDGNDRSGRGDMPGGMGGMPYFFHGFPGMQGMPWMQLMPGMPGGQGMPGPDIQIQPMPGGDRNGGGTGGWVAPGEDRAGGGTGGWVEPGADRAGGGVGGWVGPDGAPAPAAPDGGNRETAPKP